MTVDVNQTLFQMTLDLVMIYLMALYALTALTKCHTVKRWKKNEFTFYQQQNPLKNEQLKMVLLNNI